MFGSVLHMFCPIRADFGLEVLKFHAGVSFDLDIGDEDLIQVLWKFA